LSHGNPAWAKGGQGCSAQLFPNQGKMYEITSYNNNALGLMVKYQPPRNITNE
jgi:hypothetical protein